MRTSRFKLAAVAVVIACLLLLVPAGASAAEFRSGDSPDVPKTETIKDDLYIAGGTVTIDGRVTGDVIAAAGDVKVAGQVGGSLQVIGGRIEISGVVTGTVRIISGDVTVSGDITGDILLAGGTLALENGGTIDGDVVLVGGEVDILGPVGGDIRGSAGRLTINSRVGGNVDVTVDTVTLLSKARIAGDFTYASRRDASIAAGAVVTGKTERSEPNRYYPGDNAGSWLTSPLFRLLCGLIAGLILILLMPGAAVSVADATRMAPLTSLLLGIALLICLPIAFGVLLVTLVGVPIAIIGFAGYFSVLYLSQVFLGTAIGRFILPSSWDTRSRGYNLLAMTIGVLILGGLRMAPAPFVSSLIALLTGVMALGAVAVAIRTARQRGGLPAH